MSYQLPVFVSSTCYELRDLRAAIKTWLAGLGLTPMMSDEAGFPHVDGMPPYATCLRVLEGCPLVVGVVDRQYGRAFENWGPYSQYSGCAPTHAELRHALDLGKRVLIYVHNDTWAFYEVWRKNPEMFKASAPAGLQEETLQMFHELKLRDPAPWIERFSDANDVVESLQLEFINQLYAHLRERERQTADLASYLLEKMLEAAPEVRKKIEADLSPGLVAERDELSRRLAEIERELVETRGASEASLQALASQKANLDTQITEVGEQLINARLLLASAALKDASWLDWVRRTMLPKQPSRVPFHNSAEVALRGYHAAAGAQLQVPNLLEVTWSKVPYAEGGLHRGYEAALIFKGSGFGPGATFTARRCGQDEPRSGESQWRLPNIYFGDYLEVSAGGDEIEGPLSWRDYEFQVKNPEGRTSTWVKFSYPFDIEGLKRLQANFMSQGEQLLKDGQAAEAVEPLRKAYVFADRLFGQQADEAAHAKGVWNRAIDDAALSKLRFREGQHLAVRSGPYVGRAGIVQKLLLRHVHAYLIKADDNEEPFQASDEQVELLSASTCKVEA